MRQLVIALDAVAGLRDAAGPAAADPAACATLAQLAGADALQLGITEEIQGRREPDVRDLRRASPVLELRLTPAPGLLKLALEVQPERVVFATESARVAGTGGPLDFRAWGSALPAAVRMLREAGITVIARVGPELEAVKAAHAADVEGIDLYTAALVDLPMSEQRSALERIADAGRIAAKLRLGIGLAGGLDLTTLEPLLRAVPAAERVCLGRAFSSRALLVGVDRAVRDLRARIG